MRAEPKPKAVPSASVWGAEGPLPAYVASIAMFLICMDTLITNVALPTIEAELGGGMAAQQCRLKYTLLSDPLLPAF